MMHRTSSEEAISASGFVKLVCGRWLDWITIALALLATFSTLLLTLRAIGFAGEQMRVWSALIISAVVCSVLLWCRQGLTEFCVRTLNCLGGFPLWTIVVFGLCLRVLWMLLFPASPGSDGAVYISAAQQLSRGGPYLIDSTYAYWPVGYPLFLTPWVFLFEDAKWAYLTSNVFLYLVAVLGIACLGKALAGPVAGRIAALLFAVWPNLVFQSATPEKEMLVVALLPWALTWVVLALNGRGVRFALLGGLLVGAATLVQPSLQFLPLVGAILFVGLLSPTKKGLISAALIVVGAAIVVAPWTYRNHLVFDSFVLVATNGGDNLYRANNPLATGGWVASGEVDMSHMGELERDVEGRRLAVEWIKSDPSAFAALMLEKMFRFMGDDAVGVYTTLKVGNASDNAAIYAVLKLGANAWWVLLWMSLALLVLASRKQGRLAVNARIPIWLWLYLFAIHSIFESAGKYHVPVLWVICVLIATYASSLISGDRGSPR